jgi:hypothetical protein
MIGIRAAFTACLLQWAAVALFRNSLPKGKWLVILFLVLHYAIAGIVLTSNASEYCDWEVLNHAPANMRWLLALGFAWYLSGQVLMWRTAFSKPRRG